MKTSAEAIAQIEIVDQLLDANMTALFMRARSALRSCNDFHNAYQRCPDLEIRRDVLIRQRGRLQVERDRLINREWPAEQRRLRAAAKAEMQRRARTTALAA